MESKSVTIATIMVDRANILTLRIGLSIPYLTQKDGDSTRHNFDQSDQTLTNAV